MTEKQFNIIAIVYIIIATIITTAILCIFAGEIADYIFTKYDNEMIQSIGWFFESINQYLN